MIQKATGWSVTVKRLWDEERRRPDPLSVVLLGFSSLQLHRGMSESLAGRFLLHRCMHWSFPECAEAFGWGLGRWIYFGGYPGAEPFVENEAQWVRYIADALIETAISRDVLQMHTVAKPALLRSRFGLAATHPAQILSWNKMLGQLVDAGNTTTLSHYADLLETAFLLSALPLYSAGTARKRAGSPKLILWNNALVSGCGGVWGEVRSSSGEVLLRAPLATLRGGRPSTTALVWRLSPGLTVCMKHGIAHTNEDPSHHHSRTRGASTCQGDRAAAAHLGFRPPRVPRSRGSVPVGKGRRRRHGRMREPARTRWET